MTEQDITSTKIKELCEALEQAHHDAAINNNNISKNVCLASYEGSNDPIKGVAAGLLSIGGKHGPLSETRHVFAMFKASQDNAIRMFDAEIRVGQKIPGVGNSFFKESIDPAFNDVYIKYIELCNILSSKNYILEYSNAVSQSVSRFKGKEITLFPNAALITAGVAELLNLIPFFENWFFISGRSRAWLEIMGQAQELKYKQ